MVSWLTQVKEYFVNLVRLKRFWEIMSKITGSLHKAIMRGTKRVSLEQIKGYVLSGRPPVLPSEVSLSVSGTETL